MDYAIKIELNNERKLYLINVYSLEEENVSWQVTKNREDFETLANLVEHILPYDIQDSKNGRIIENHIS